MSIKKLLASTLILGAVLPLVSFAQTGTTTSTTTPSLPSNIQTLLDQIKALQAQINALVEQQNTNVTNLISTLKQGSTGDEVKQLQILLASDPTLYPEGLITGFFGPKTAAAVKKFQARNGLDQVGDVGPKTLAKLNSIFKNKGQDGDSQGSDNGKGKPCPAAVPPGHLIAPGWIKNNGGETPTVPPCQTLPPGILNKLGSTTPPTGSTTTPADAIAPVVSSISVGSLASTSVNVMWMTNEPAGSKVYFATSSPVNLSTAASISNTSLVTSHTTNLSGLTSNTVYFYVIEARDAANNVATTTSLTFQTSAI